MNTEIKAVMGTTRIVFAIPCLGIAIKVARIQPVNALFALVKEIERAVIHNDWHLFFKYFWFGRHKYNRAAFSLFHYLFSGIHANQIEYRAWNKFGHQKPCPFIKTYCSFIGLINIVPYRVCPEEGEYRIWLKLVDKIPFKTLWRECHTFSEEKNYCFEEGCLKLIDYGSINVVAAAHRHRKIFASISPLPA